MGVQGTQFPAGGTGAAPPEKSFPPKDTANLRETSYWQKPLPGGPFWGENSPGEPVTDSRCGIYPAKKETTMSEMKILSAKKRTLFGKGHNRRLIASGEVPAVYYSAVGENIALQANAKTLSKMYSEVGRTTVFELELEDGGKTVKHPVLFWDIRRDPVKDNMTHVDFYGVDLEKPVRVTVPLVFKGTARGTKVGGTLETYRERVVLQAKPLEMPSSVTVDITGLDVNKTIYVADIELPAGVSAVYDTNYAIVAVLIESDDEEETAAK